jgi:hypothetical protein
MQRKVTYPGQNIELVVDLVFPGERIEIRNLHFQGRVGYIATQYLTGLGLPKIIRAIAVDSQLSMAQRPRRSWKRPFRPIPGRTVLVRTHFLGKPPKRHYEVHRLVSSKYQLASAKDC